MTAGPSPVPPRDQSAHRSLREKPFPSAAPSLKEGTMTIAHPNHVDAWRELRHASTVAYQRARAARAAAEEALASGPSGVRDYDYWMRKVAAHTADGDAFLARARLLEIPESA